VSQENNAQINDTKDNTSADTPRKLVNDPRLQIFQSFAQKNDINMNRGSYSGSFLLL